MFIKNNRRNAISLEYKQQHVKSASQKRVFLKIEANKTAYVPKLTNYNDIITKAFFENGWLSVVESIDASTEKMQTVQPETVIPEIVVTPTEEKVEVVTPIIETTNTEVVAPAIETTTPDIIVSAQTETQEVVPAISGETASNETITQHEA